MKVYRSNGAIGALLDEYEKALRELIIVISDLSKDDLSTVVDHVTEDEDCKSIQTILSHVLNSGYTYGIEVRKWLGEDIDYMAKKVMHSSREYSDALHRMFDYNEQLFKDYPQIQLNENDSENKILVRWGQKYDVEQLYEHAIVHILRHRRQIERFLLLLYPNR